MSVFGSYRVPRIPYDWYALRDAYCDSVHEPIMLNQGGPAEEPLTVELALGWAERLADEVLNHANPYDHGSTLRDR